MDGQRDAIGEEVKITFTGPDYAPASTWHWPLWNAVLATWRFFTPRFREETEKERTLRLIVEDLERRVKELERDLDYEKKASQGKEVQIAGMVKVVAFHEAHWKALAEIQAIKTIKAQMPR